VTSRHDEEFATFIHDRGQALARTAFLLTGHAQEAEDLLQIALLRLLKHWPRLEDRQNADAYVRRIMVTTRVSGWRRRWRGEQSTAILPERAEGDETAASDQRQVLIRALSLVPPGQRAAVVLRHYDGLSEADTAAVLGCSIGTVKSQTARGLAKLRQILGEEGAAPSTADVADPIERETSR
jgi:RNA polymerase sigma-70 factor (ECF subfamily)